MFTKRNDFCLEPQPCAGHTCRMFCPHGFALAQDGCPLCKCRDPCEDIRCPSALACHLEDLSCSDPPCPPVPTCKFNFLLIVKRKLEEIRFIKARAYWHYVSESFMDFLTLTVWVKIHKYGVWGVFNRINSSMFRNELLNILDYIQKLSILSIFSRFEKI